MWLTVLASQPSVSIDTDTTQRICSPSLPALPTVFITSRMRSSSVSLDTSAPGLRLRYSFLNAASSVAAAALNSGLNVSPDSRAAESISTVRGRSSHSPSTTLDNNGNLPGRAVDVPLSWGTSRPAIHSNTSLDTVVLGHTTIITGGGSPAEASVASHVWKRLA
jgi:hypothetical protein